MDDLGRLGWIYLNLRILVEHSFLVELGFRDGLLFDAMFNLDYATVLAVLDRIGGLVIGVRRISFLFDVVLI